MKKVWVNGTFDILHIGHIRLLNFAKSFGIVRVGLDNCIKEWEPDVFVIGTDYIDKPIIGGGLAKEIKFFKKVDGMSTSKILGDE